MIRLMWKSITHNVMEELHVQPSRWATFREVTVLPAISMIKISL